MNIHIQTERLIIRPFTDFDYSSWFGGFDKRLPSQYKYDEGRPEDLKLSTFSWYREWIREFKEMSHRQGRHVLGIFRKEDGSNIGKLELFRLLEAPYHWAVMGYSIHNQYWKQGYGIESVLATVNFGYYKMNLHRIELHINPDNEPSLKLAEKAGFKLECVRERFSFEEGEWRDMLVYYRNADKGAD